MFKGRHKRMCSFFFFQVKKTKNVSFDQFGSKLGRVHMQRQDLSKLQTRKMKGLKRSRTAADEEPSSQTKKKLKSTAITG